MFAEKFVKSIYYSHVEFFLSVICKYWEDKILTGRSCLTQISLCTVGLMIQCYHTDNKMYGYR